MVQASLCSGFGAADLAALWMGWENAFWCETDEFCRKVLKYWFKNSIGYEDITKTDFIEWQNKIDVLTAGFPCQPFSTAGKRRGAEDDRYLWPAVCKIIGDVRPTWFIGENVNGIISMVQPGEEVNVENQASIFEENYKEMLLEQEYVVETICRDLERAGYSVQPYVVPACSVGAPHLRYRCFFVAHATGTRRRATRYNVDERKANDEKGNKIPNKSERYGNKQPAPNSRSKHIQGRRREDEEHEFSGLNRVPDWNEFPTQSPVCRRDDGFSERLDNITFSSWRRRGIKGFGNAIVPQVMFEFFKAINEVENYGNTKTATKIINDGKRNNKRILR
jgi:DNA (cytosine-5)-methyltransferase 1